MIVISNVFKSFGDNVVLRGLSLVIEKGETMVIIGRSGCGKSVLLKLIVGLIKPDSGKIEIDGIDIGKLNERELNKVRMRFGVLFQSGALFDSLTVEENVGFFLSEHTTMKKEVIRSIVKEKLSLVELFGVEKLMPASLSGGMKKRVALARAIAMNPEIVLYDEPTTGIDPVMASTINRLIKDLDKRLGLTSVIVTHDMNSAYAVADRIAMLYEGRIIEVGTPEEIKNSKNPIVKQFITGSPEGPITDSTN